MKRFFTIFQIMMKLLAAVCLMIPGFSAFSQTWLIGTHGKTVGYFISMEDKLGSTAVKQGLYIGNPGLAQPICFRRKENNFPDLMVTYFFYKSDSVIDNIEYNWKESNFRNTFDSKYPKSPVEITPYLKKYQDIYSGIKARYGAGEIIGGLDTSAMASDHFKLDNKVKWLLKDSSRLELSIYLSNEYMVSGNMSVYPQYSVSFTITNPSRPDEGPDESPISENKIHAMDSAYQLFLKDLKKNDINSARAKLSPLLINKVSNAQLIELRKFLRLDERSVIFMSGIQLITDGSIGSMLQYKYESDKGIPPTELVKVIFDRSGKILGVRPIKRQ